MTVAAINGRPICRWLSVPTAKTRMNSGVIAVVTDGPNKTRSCRSVRTVRVRIRQVQGLAEAALTTPGRPVSSRVAGVARICWADLSAWPQCWVASSRSRTASCSEDKTHRHPSRWPVRCAQSLVPAWPAYKLDGLSLVALKVTPPEHPRYRLRV